jgi:tRNA A-37 threonylcarbamoyl transferase component Bud32
MAPSLKSRIAANIRKIKPWIVVKLVFTILYLAPGFLWATAKSWPKMRRWRRREQCLAFVKAHPHGFNGVDPESIEIRPLSGGVSNSNQVWRFRLRNGGFVEYFAKVFLPVGSYWAKNLCLLSPFPLIAHGSLSERFHVDRKTRGALLAQRVPVPRVVAYDAKEGVLVTEFLTGENADEVLKRAVIRGGFEASDREMIRRCGAELAKAHQAGYWLVDTQPVNCLWDERDLKVFFTDLEFSTREDRSHWDAGFFLTFLGLRLPREMKAEAATLFLDNYRAVRPMTGKDLAVTTGSLEDYVPLMEMILDARQFTPEELLQELAR